MTPAGRACLAAAVFTLLAGAQDSLWIQVEMLAKGQTFTEGPAWSKEGYLIFSDTPSDRLLKWVPGHAVETFREDAHGPAGNAFDLQGRLYTCETRSRRVTRTAKNGKIDVLAESWEGKRLNAPDNLAVSRGGHVYFTDPAFGAQSDRRELDFYGVYHIPPRGPIKLVAKPAGRPTGIALSPNGRVLYVAVADEHAVRAFDVDRDGDASGERVLVSGIAGVPGGISTDDKGNLYVAANGIAVYNPEGRLIRTIEIRERPSNCSFGDGDMKTLFVTARGFVYRVRSDAKGAN